MSTAKKKCQLSNSRMNKNCQNCKMQKENIREFSVQGFMLQGGTLGCNLKGKCISYNERHSNTQLNQQSSS